jgi:chorismate mutase
VNSSNDSERLGELRQQIDTIDFTVLALLSLRFGVTREVGRIKVGSRMPLVDPNRERQQLEHQKVHAQQLGVPVELAIGLQRMIIDTVVEEHRQEQGR